MVKVIKIEGKEGGVRWKLHKDRVALVDEPRFVRCVQSEVSLSHIQGSPNSCHLRRQHHYGLFPYSCYCA